ncbi:MAG: sensor histidine kinase [Burkholderiales bacterium]
MHRTPEPDRTLRATHGRLATVNDALRAVNAAFATIGAPDSIGAHLSKAAAALRGIVPATVALAVSFPAESGAGPAIGIDADPALPGDELERWRAAGLDSDRSATPPAPGGRLRERLPALLLDAHGRARGHLLLGREAGRFEAEDEAVLSHFALRVGASLAMHETLALERSALAEAGRADRMNEEMLAVVSHELRTPLNAIQGWLHVLRHRRADDTELLGRAIDVIQRNLDTEVHLVDDLLDTARIIGGKLELVRRPLDLVPLLRAAVETVRPLAEGKRVALSLSVPSEPFVSVGDPDRLEQVIRKLLTNAVKFTGPGGHVTVRLERLGGLGQLEVEDDGQGIEPSFLPRMFVETRSDDADGSPPQVQR